MADIQSVLTQKGAQCIARWLASGASPTFSGAQIGTGLPSPGDDLTELTALITAYDDSNISGAVTQGSTLIVTAQYINSAVQTAVSITEIGIFAMDPIDGEVLFGYVTLGSYPDLVVAAAQSAMIRSYDFSLSFSAGGVTATVQINPSSLISADDVANAGTAGKLIRANADGKLATSITGDAATVGGNAPCDFAAAVHGHGTATSSVPGFMSAADKQNLDVIILRVNQSVNSNATPTFSGLTVNGYIDGALFR